MLQGNNLDKITISYIVWIVHSLWTRLLYARDLCCARFPSVSSGRPKSPPHFQVGTHLTNDSIYFRSPRKVHTVKSYSTTACLRVSSTYVRIDNGVIDRSQLIPVTNRRNASWFARPRHLVGHGKIAIHCLPMRWAKNKEGPTHPHGSRSSVAAGLASLLLVLLLLYDVHKSAIAVYIPIGERLSTTARRKQ